MKQDGKCKKLTNAPHSKVVKTTTHWKEKQTSRKKNAGKRVNWVELYYILNSQKKRIIYWVHKKKNSQKRSQWLN